MTSMVQEFDIFGVFHCWEKGASNGKKKKKHFTEVVQNEMKCGL